MSQPSTRCVRQAVVTSKMPSTYEARYLWTTDLSSGSQVDGARDPNSYAKRGLLHQGQKPREQFEMPVIDLKQKDEQAATPSKTGGSRERLSAYPQRNARVKEIWKDSQSRRHAGQRAMPKPGFAKNFAESRSGLGGLAKILASGSHEVARESEESNDDVTSTEVSLPVLVKLDQATMPFSSLGKLKNQRLNEVYSGMLKKHRSNRMKLIMDKVSVAEKIKERLRLNELTTQRRLLKTSVESQRSQLRELRERHRKDLEFRVNSLYSVDQARKLKNELTIDTTPAMACVRNGDVTPRSAVFGLPENENESTSFPTAKKKEMTLPFRISLSSLHQTDRIPSKFNNVWNVVNSPRNRPQTTAIVDSVA